MPVIRNFMAAPLSQPRSPAMAGALSAQTGIGVIGLKSSVAPFSHWSFTGSPFSSRGVWQSPHKPISSTRYLPRATLAAAVRDFAVLAVCAANIGTISNATTVTARNSFIRKTPVAQGEMDSARILALRKADLEPTTFGGFALPV